MTALVPWEHTQAFHDHGVRAIVSNYDRGHIEAHTALRQLREKGLTEPEIWELIDASLSQ